MRVQVPGEARDFSPRVNFQWRLLRCLYSPRVQSYASTSVRTLQIPNTLAAIPLSGHRKILHTLIGMGSAALAAAVPYPGKVNRISRKGQGSLKKKKKKMYQAHVKTVCIKTTQRSISGLYRAHVKTVCIKTTQRSISGLYQAHVKAVCIKTTQRSISRLIQAHVKTVCIRTTQRSISGLYQFKHMSRLSALRLHKDPYQDCINSITCQDCLH